MTSVHGQKLWAKSVVIHMNTCLLVFFVRRARNLTRDPQLTTRTPTIVLNRKSFSYVRLCCCTKTWEENLILVSLNYCMNVKLLNHTILFYRLCQLRCRILAYVYVCLPHFRSASTSCGDTSQIRIWRSSGRSQDHRRKPPNFYRPFSDLAHFQTRGKVWFSSVRWPQRKHIGNINNAKVCQNAGFTSQSFVGQSSSKLKCFPFVNSLSRDVVLNHPKTDNFGHPFLPRESRLHVMQRTVFPKPSVLPSVRLYVCQTRALWQNERKFGPLFLYHMKDHSS